jgi:hypothetical protein
MDEDTVTIANKSLDSAVSLSASDKKWIDSVIQAVKETWDADDPLRTKDLTFHGSEDYIRVQFEDYIMHLLSSVKYDAFLTKLGSSARPTLIVKEIQGNPLHLYNINWAKEWKTTNNYRIFNKFTDDELFDIVEPRHLGGPVTSYPRQIIGGVDERLAPARAGIAKGVTKVFGGLWGTQSPSQETVVEQVPSDHDDKDELKEDGKADANSVSESVRTEGHRSQESSSTMSSTVTAAAAPREGYFTGFSRWAAEKRRQVFQKSPSPSTPPAVSRTPSLNEPTTHLEGAERAKESPDST